MTTAASFRTSRKPGRAVFIMFCKLTLNPFPAIARNAILDHCLYDNGKRFQLHAAVVMPEHVHLLLTPLNDETGWPCGLPLILKQLKGISARSVNMLLQSCGPVWQEESFDHILRTDESLKDKLEYIRQNPVRRGLVLKPEDYKWLWLCGSDTPVRPLSISTTPEVRPENPKQK